LLAHHKLVGSCFGIIPCMGLKLKKIWSDLKCHDIHTHFKNFGDCCQTLLILWQKQASNIYFSLYVVQRHSKLVKIIQRHSEMNDWIWNIGRMMVTEENQSNRRKTCSIATLSATNPTWLAWDSTRNFAVKARQPTAAHFYIMCGRQSDTCLEYRDLATPLNVHKGIYPGVLKDSVISCSVISRFTPVSVRLFTVTWLAICWTKKRDMRSAGELHCYTVCITYRYPSVCPYVLTLKSLIEFPFLCIVYSNSC